MVFVLYFVRFYKKSFKKLLWNNKIFIILQHRLLALRGKRAVLYIKKDVFGRLSLWAKNFANS